MDIRAAQRPVHDLDSHSDEAYYLYNSRLAGRGPFSRLGSQSGLVAKEGQTPARHATCRCKVMDPQAQSSVSRETDMVTHEALLLGAGSHLAAPEN